MPDQSTTRRINVGEAPGEEASIEKYIRVQCANCCMIDEILYSTRLDRTARCPKCESRALDIVDAKKSNVESQERQRLMSTWGTQPAYYHMPTVTSSSSGISPSIMTTSIGPQQMYDSAGMPSAIPAQFQPRSSEEDTLSNAAIYASLAQQLQNTMSSHADTISADVERTIIADMSAREDADLLRIAREAIAERLAQPQATQEQPRDFMNRIAARTRARRDPVLNGPDNTDSDPYPAGSYSSPF
jgi:hypothetical protein